MYKTLTGLARVWMLSILYPFFYLYDTLSVFLTRLIWRLWFYMPTYMSFSYLHCPQTFYKSNMYLFKRFYWGLNSLFSSIIHQSFDLSICLSAYLIILILIFFSYALSTHLSLSLSLQSTIYLPTHLSIYLSIRFAIYFVST